MKYNETIWPHVFGVIAAGLAILFLLLISPIILCFVAKYRLTEWRKRAKIAGRNQKLINLLNDKDYVFVSGEASSHCTGASFQAIADAEEKRLNDLGFTIVRKG